MFNIAKTATFRRKVTVNVPDGDGVREEDFLATFEALSEKEAEAFDFFDNKATTEFLRRVIVRLDNVVGEDGEALQYSSDLRDAVLDLPYARVALVATYFREVTGAKLGN